MFNHMYWHDLAETKKTHEEIKWFEYVRLTPNDLRYEGAERSWKTAKR